ncbi:MAG: hypothetical protein WCY09_08985 [Candidatus Omnitrophota bacterium]|jgi:hypothetical protein
MSLTVDVCARCKKAVVKDNPYASSDMVVIKIDASYLCDRNDNIPRPGINIDCELCPDCLLAEITDFVNKIKKIKPSELEYPEIQISGGKKIRKPRSDKETIKPDLPPCTRQTDMSEFIKQDEKPAL